MKWIMVILILALVLIAGCTQQSTQYVCSDGSTVSNPSLCPQTTPQPSQQPSSQVQPQPAQPKNLTTDEMKSTVYQTIRKYISQSTIGNFVYQDRWTGQYASDSWYYPQTTEDLSKYVIFARIDDYHYNKGGPDTLEYLLSIFSTSQVPNVTHSVYIKDIENGKILISESQTNLPDNVSREMFSMTFNCQDKYQIVIWTADFNGDSQYIWPIYKDYTIDKVAMENMANEILSKCNNP
jgi:hypothetical protein